MIKFKKVATLLSCLILNGTLASRGGENCAGGFKPGKDGGVKNVLPSKTTPLSSVWAQYSETIWYRKKKIQEVSAVVQPNVSSWQIGCCRPAVCPVLNLTVYTGWSVGGSVTIPKTPLGFSITPPSTATIKTDTFQFVPSPSQPVGVRWRAGWEVEERTVDLIGDKQISSPYYYKYYADVVINAKTFKIGDPQVFHESKCCDGCTMCN